jgi:hypothetical protein
MVIKEESPGNWKAKMAMVMTKKKRLYFFYLKKYYYLKPHFNGSDFSFGTKDLKTKHWTSTGNK